MSRLYEDYLKTASDKISKSRFRDDLKHNGLVIEKVNGNMYAINIKYKLSSDFDDDEDNKEN